MKEMKQLDIELEALKVENERLKEWIKILNKAIDNDDFIKEVMRPDYMIKYADGLKSDQNET